MAQQTNPVNWFEIPVSDLNRARRFYEQVFGVSLAPNDMGPMQMAWFPNDQDASGASGTLIKAEGYTPSQDGSLVYFAVDDIDATLKKASLAGGATLVPKMSIGEHGFIAHLQDSEGNRIALHSRT